VAALRRPSFLRSAVATPHRGAVEAATLASLYGVYELARGGGNATLAVAQRHTDSIVALEQHLHLYGERAVQRAAHNLPGLPAALGASYMLLHFVGTLGFVVWAYRRRPESFPFIRNTLIATTAIALAVYVIYPAAPPRLAGLGFSDTVSAGAHVNLSSNLLGSLYNPFAAVPSLHFGYALLVGVGVATLARNRTARVLGAVYPLVMLFVIVATGNHFFFDALAGGLVVAAAAAVARALSAPAIAPGRRARAESAVAPC
jgi:PAP2 superfamily